MNYLEDWGFVTELYVVSANLQACSLWIFDDLYNDGALGAFHDT